MNIEAEIGSVLEHDSDTVPVASGFDFYTIHDLAFDLRETAPFASAAGTCNFNSSQCASNQVLRLGLHSV